MLHFVEKLRYKPWGRNVGLESTQPITKMCTKDHSWVVKAADA
jgi:hypothetical protein